MHIIKINFIIYLIIDESVYKIEENTITFFKFISTPLAYFNAVQLTKRNT